MTFQGDLYLDASSTLYIEIFGFPEALHDFIIVTGKATVLGNFPVIVNYTSSYGDQICVMTFSSSFILPSNLQIFGATSNQGIVFNAFNGNLTLTITNKAAIEAGVITSILVPLFVTIGVLLIICCIIIIILIIIICCISGGVGTGIAVKRKLTTEHFF